ncbi:MAG TPA: hypothetical protein PLD47_00610 [Aggregatilineales bacterium]|nr:hypothetical protein [Anaerolineales bacterium]HRE46200.1 hypothetical protein [Aggregatilineales bacterium]
MELLSLWRVVRRWWWLIALPTLIAFLLALPALPAALRPAASYTVGVRFSASQPPQRGATFEDQSYIPWLASEYAVINLAAWVKTDSFAREVCAILATGGMLIEADAIRGAIASDAVRSIMGVYLTWTDAKALETIMAAAIRALQTKASAYFPQLAAAETQIIPLDAVIVVPVATPLTARLAPFLRVLIGFVAGVGLAFLAEYLDPRLRGRREAETALGLPIVGEIPREG